LLVVLFVIEPWRAVFRRPVPFVCKGNPRYSFKLCRLGWIGIGRNFHVLLFPLVQVFD
jgi:hypothetical protein